MVNNLVNYCQENLENDVWARNFTNCEVIRADNNGPEYSKHENNIGEDEGPLSHLHEFAEFGRNVVGFWETYHFNRCVHRADEWPSNNKNCQQTQKSDLNIIPCASRLGMQKNPHKVSGITCDKKSNQTWHKKKIVPALN